MMNSQEMETAVRLGLNLVVLIIQIAPPGQKGFYASWQSASQQVAVKFSALTGAF
jgi:MHS family citrate/tricarballylate:H+ symporter-like MFS transporter